MRLTATSMRSCESLVCVSISPRFICNFSLFFFFVLLCARTARPWTLSIWMLNFYVAAASALYETYCEMIIKRIPCTQITFCVYLLFVHLPLPLHLSKLFLFDFFFVRFRLKCVRKNWTKANELCRNVCCWIEKKNGKKSARARVNKQL